MSHRNTYQIYPTSINKIPYLFEPDINRNTGHEIKKRGHQNQFQEKVAMI